ESSKSAIHYHIRWSNSSLDWQPFPTEEEATTLAGQIKKRNESFTDVITTVGLATDPSRLCGSNQKGSGRRRPR
ncbi:MAG TPA: hypothetical protein VGU64_06005, partial [Terriglobales bacterium]|nr:hypothetical protein [Terriglobales bacterium]